MVIAYSCFQNRNSEEAGRCRVHLGTIDRRRREDGQPQVPGGVNFPSGHVGAAVEEDVLAGDEAAFGAAEEPDEAGDLFDGAETTDRRRGAGPGVVAGGDAGGVDHERVDAVDGDAAAGELASQGL